MERSWLIQRLKMPSQVDNPFSFGGGMKNGGLSDDAMGLIRSIWSFDYMGAAEFEYGAVPEALQKIARMAEAGDLGTSQFTIPFSQVEHKYSWPKGTPLPKEKPPIYTLGRKEDLPEIETRVRGFAAKPHEGLKEGTRLNNALLPVKPWDLEYIGWLELNNGFFFFTNLVAFEKTKKLFGIE